MTLKEQHQVFAQTPRSCEIISADPNGYLNTKLDIDLFLQYLYIWFLIEFTLLIGFYLNAGFIYMYTGQIISL